MFHTISKWLISRLVEREAPLPPWLRRWVDRDEELLRFESASRRLTSRLRSDAPAWTARQSSDVRAEQLVPAAAHYVRPPAAWYRRPAARVGALCALAASIMLAFAWWQGLTTEHVPSPTISDQALAVQGAGGPISPREGAQLMAAWQASRVHVAAWPARLKDAARRFEAIELRSPATIRPSWEIADATPQRLRRKLSAAVSSQRQEFAAGMKSAYAFFTHRLPTSVAILVGLQDG